MRMYSTDESLREQLNTLAGDAGPLELETGRVVHRVRRRRRVAGTSAVFAVVLVLALGSAGLVRYLPLAGAPRVAGGSPTPSAPSDRGFACGDQFQPVPSVDDGDLTITLHTITETGPAVGPRISIVVDSPQHYLIVGDRDAVFQVLYLRDGRIVGGGPFLRAPGDNAIYANGLIPYIIDTDPKIPSIIDVGPRDRLCPGYDWPSVWADAQAYQVVILFGDVRDRRPWGDPPTPDPTNLRVAPLAGTLNLTNPWPGRPSITVTTPLRP